MASSPQVMLTKAWGKRRSERGGEEIHLCSRHMSEVVDERKGMKSCWQALILSICTRSNQVENPFLVLVPPAAQPAA